MQIELLDTSPLKVWMGISIPGKKMDIRSVFITLKLNLCG